MPTPASGTLEVLTYNVAGLPEPLSSSSPIPNTPLMSPLLNNYALVLVQEDFAYHEALAADAEQPYQSEPADPGTFDLGDGLNRFSESAFDGVDREAWEACNGVVGGANDCLTPKGFSFARHELAPGVELDVYNLHMDAGGGDGDMEARAAQVVQLVAAIADRSGDRAVLVAGDTNMNGDDEDEVQTLLSAAGLSDACRSLDCGEPERIDRVMFRSSDALELAATSWGIDERFVDADGEPLSDHEAVAVSIDWSER